MTPNNLFAFASDFGDSITQFTFNSTTGALTPNGVLTLSVQAGDNAVTPNGQFLYVTEDASNAVQGFSISGTGTLTALSQGPVATGDSNTGAIERDRLAMDPLGRFLVTQNLSSNTIVVFSIGTNGSLTPVSGSPFPALENDPLFSTFDPTGTFLYTSGTLNHQIQSFLVTP